MKYELHYLFTRISSGISYLVDNTDETKVYAGKDLEQLVNQLYEENQALKSILKEISTGMAKNEDYCELTVGIPSPYYDKIKEVLLNENS